MRRLIVLLVCVLCLACEKKAEKDIPATKRAAEQPAQGVAQQLEQYLDLYQAIVQKPPDLISVTAPIELTFRDPVVPPHRADTILEQSPFSFEPDIAGRAKWLSTSKIQFQPNQPLPPGTIFRGTFKGKIAFGSQKQVNDFEFTFKTAEQEIITFSGDFLPDESGQNMVRYRGRLTFAQPVELNAIKKDLKCRRGRFTIPLTVEQDAEDATQIVISSAPLKRTDKGQIIAFILPGSYTVDKGKWEKEVLLPAAYVFKVVTHMDMSDPQAAQSTYGFRFSDPIRSDMDLSGFVSIAPEVPYTITISGKYLKVQGDFLPGASYTMTIAEGFPSAFGTKLDGQYTALFSLTNIKPEIIWLSEGIYLPSTNDFKVQLKSVNVARARITVTEVFENNLGFFVQSNVLEKRPTRRSYYGSESYSDLSRVGKEIYDEQISLSQTPNRWIKTELDLSPVFKDKRNTAFIIGLKFDKDDLCGRCVSTRDDIQEGDLYYEDDGYYTSPCRDGYYYRNGTISKLLMASDIGLTLKKAEDGLHAYATDVIRAQPASGVSLTLYTYQNQVLQRVRTDRTGHALFTGSDDGYYIKGEEDAGLAVIKLDHSPWELNTFDISGVSEGKGGINAFLYTDRGVHRPGDTIHLSAIVRTDRKLPPQDQPVLLKVLNPKQQTVHEARQPCGDNGHVYFAIPTALSDPTGTWQAELTIAGKVFTKALKVETVKPNRLKIHIELPDTLSPDTHVLEGMLYCRYLFGAPASNLKAQLKIDLTDRDFSTKAFEKYTFRHPLREYERRTDTVFEDPLDESGAHSIRYPMDDLSGAPGLVDATVQATVYEKGGNFTKHTKRVTIVPYSAFVGIRNDFGGRGAQIGEKFALPIVAVDVHGKPVAGHILKVKCYVNRRHWWWDYDRHDRRDFRTMESTYKVGEFTYISGDEPLKHEFTAEDYGQHFLEVMDETSGHETGLFFWASQWGQPAPTEEEERVFLNITADKDLYYTGDKAQISFETPQKGMALFTLEQGDRILKQEVKPVKAGLTTFSVDITEELLPNAYAVISLVQPHGQSENDLPMRIYGVKPIYVEDIRTRLPLALSVPDELRPNQPFTVALTSHAPKPATYTIAVVDEGLLDLTGFETPDPWEHYFKKLRLGVVTRDNFDEILGMLLPDMDTYFTIGGDEDLERRKRAGEPKVQRFKPVVLFQHPITIQPGETEETTFTMPNYVGSVRVMVVGSSEGSYGAFEKTVPVREPLMILTTIPRVARPGDLFSVPVSVFAMESGIDTVSVSAHVSDEFLLHGDTTQVLVFERPGEKDIDFSLSVREHIGAGTITVTAVSGAHRTHSTVDLPITSPNPFYTRVTDTSVVRGRPVTLIPRKVGIEGTNGARLSFTRIPDIQLHKRLNYLIRYPYGCIEQTVSSVFPQLYMNHLLDLTSAQQQATTDNIHAGIDRLSRFMLPENGFAFWPVSHRSGPHFSDWGTNYAGHFLLEAQALGYHVPRSLLSHWRVSAQRMAKQVNRENHRYQTYRLFLLSLGGQPNQGAMNLVQENYLAELDPLSRKFLAAAFYLAGQKSAAEQIDRYAPTEITTYRELSGTFGSALRDRALIAYLALKMDDLNTASKLIRSIARDFKPYGWYSTQETAMALLALSTMYAKSPFTGGAVAFTVAMKGEKPQEMWVKGYQTSLDVSSMWDQKITITTEGDNPLFVSLFEEGIPLDSPIQTEHWGIELTRNFYNDEGQPILVENLKQGTPFWVRYGVKSTTSEYLKELALSSLFPSGWEIINLRLEGISPPEWVEKLRISEGTYMDIRDDRVNWFFDLSPRQSANFAVKLNPTFKGRYRLPPVVVEAMYSPDYYARIAGGEVDVR